MTDQIAEFDAATIAIAIDLVAQKSQSQTGRHIEWIKRRLRDAVAFTGKNGTNHPDYAAYRELAFPVWAIAAQLNGMRNNGSIH